MNDPEPSDEVSPWKTRLKRNGNVVYRAIKSYSLILSLILLLTVAFLWPRIFINVYPGENGVLWRRFIGGTDLRHPYGEGLHILWPWDKMHIYDTRIQQVSHDFDALSRSGLPIRFELSIRYRPQKHNLPRLHQDIGPDYVEIVVKPEVQTYVREVVANYLPEEIYTSEGLLLQIIKQGALAGLDRRNIVLDDLLIKRMELPERIREAIEHKLTAEQQSLRYDFLLQKEAKEADRKRIEAEGIRDFQKIVMTGGAFSEYLNFQGILATLELSRSNNSKVVVLGNRDSGGLPLLFSLPVDESASKGTPGVQAAPISDEPPAVESDIGVGRVMEMLNPSTRKLLEGIVSPETVDAVEDESNNTQELISLNH